MTEETIETSSTSISANRRNQLDAKTHRKVRRNCYPDYIFKHIVNGEKFTEDSRTQITDPKLYIAVERNDPFDIGSFDVRFSLNRKGRWKIVNELASNIISYQNDSTNLRVSYLKTILRDCGWVYKNDKWQESNKAFDTEFTSVKNGYEIHKRGRRANKYDLIKDPRPSKKSKKGRVVRGDFSVFNGNDNSNTKIHVLYETTSTVWDGRIRDKCDKKIAQAKRRQRSARSKTGKDYSYARNPHFVDILEVFEDENDDNFPNHLTDATVDDYLVDECNKPQFILNPADFLEPFVKISSKRNNVEKTNTDRSYARWLQTPSYMEFVDENKMTFTTTEVPTEIVEEKREKMLHAWEDEILPTCDIPLPTDITLEEYFSQRTKHFRKVDGLFPQTYFYKSTFEQEEIAPIFSRQQNVYVIIQMIPENQHSLRWIINAENEQNTKNVFALEYKLFKRKWNPAQLCPAKAFVPVEYLAEDLLQQFTVIDTISSGKEGERMRSEFNYNNNTICGVCLSEGNNGFALRCGHFFCKICWIFHSRESLLAENVPIYCMNYECSVFLTFEQAITFLPVAECEKYRTLLWRLISTRENFLRCTKCKKIMHFPKETKLNDGLAICQCNYVWCLGCRRRAHQPVPCEFATKYYELLRKMENGEDEITSSLVSVSAKICPKCEYGYQRVVGCNYMVCPVCQTNFCDRCGLILAELYGRHACMKKDPKDIPLLDVLTNLTRNDGNLMQAIYARWVQSYRKMRTRRAQAKFEKAITQSSLEYDSSYYVYFAAIEVLELCEAYVRFIKWRARSGTSSVTAKRFALEEISYRSQLLAFDITRFRNAVEKHEKDKILKWKCKTEEDLRKILQIGYRALPKHATEVERTCYSSP